MTGLCKQIVVSLFIFTDDLYLMFIEQMGSIYGNFWKCLCVSCLKESSFGIYPLYAHLTSSVQVTFCQRNWSHPGVR